MSPLLLSLFLSTASAADFDHAATRDVHFETDLVCGTLAFHPGADDAVHIKGEFGSVTPRFEGTDRQLRFVVPTKPKGWSGESTTECNPVDVTLPANASVDASSTNGSIDVHGVRGSMHLDAVNGSVTVGDAGDDVRVSTVNGSIEVEDLAGLAELTTVNGSIAVVGKKMDEIRTQTVNGDTTVRAGPVRRLEAQTVQGDVTFEGALAAGARLSLESHGGDVVIRLPAGASYTASLESFSGDIENHAGEAKPTRSTYGPGTHLDTTVGSGDAKIEAHTFSGDIELATSR